MGEGYNPGLLVSPHMIFESDVIIVGSGPAGAAAALELCSRTNVVMLDVGDTISQSSEADRFSTMLGDDLEGISNITRPYLSPKLRSPLFRYVTRRWRELTPIKSDSFLGEISLALGGLANAWGSGLYEFDDIDLQGFPISYSDLEPYYLRLTEHIGICGAGDDDSSSLLGSRHGLLPPLPLSGTPKRLFTRAQTPGRQAFLKRRGIQIGRQRLGILTRPHRGRLAYQYDRRDFFEPWKTSIYHPGYTVRELQKTGRLDYRPGVLVKRFESQGDRVRLYATRSPGGERLEFSTRHLLLGAGAINSGRIVLNSFSDHSTKLPLLENPVSFIPFVDLGSLGSRIPHDSFTGAQLVVVFEGPEHHDRVQGSFYNLAGVLPSDFFFDFPFSARGNLFCLSKVLGAMGILQLFYSDAPAPGGFIKLNDDGVLEISCAQRCFGKVERKLISAFRRLGFYSAPLLIRFGAGGGSFHYAGTLPAVDIGNGFFTDKLGKLNRCPNVYVIDASTFPRLPAKNLSLTIMANAMRIARHVTL